MRVLPDGYELVDDQSRIDPVAARRYLVGSYWSKGISQQVVSRAIAGSFCVAIFHREMQVAFARLITDYATFGYLSDMYVLEEHRKKGLSHAMLEHLLGHERLQGFRRWALSTLDAQGLYRQHGFENLDHPERVMTLDDPDVYKR